VLSQHPIKYQVPVHFSFSVGATQKENKRKIIARWIHREEEGEKKGQNEVNLMFIGPCIIVIVEE